MRRFIFALCLLVFVGCDKENESNSVVPELQTESFDAPFDGEYQYGYQCDDMTFDYFYNEEYAYWGGFVQSRVFDADVNNGKYENQYAVYNTQAASGDSFLLYYYDSYSEPCDIRFNQLTSLEGVKLNLTTYTYASITDEDINTFARKFEDGDFLKVVFTPIQSDNLLSHSSVECYVVDFRDGKRFVADNWQKFELGSIVGDSIRVTIETSDVGEYGANTPLYICMDDLEYREATVAE